MADLIALLTKAQESVCSLKCPSTWKTAEGRPPHHEECRAISDAINAARPEAMPQEPTMDMMLAWVNAGVRPEFRSVPGSLSAVDIDQMTMRYKAMMAAMRLAMNSRPIEPEKP